VTFSPWAGFLILAAIFEIALFIILGGEPTREEHHD
jgi:hypothetical protein